MTTNYRIYIYQLLLLLLVLVPDGGASQREDAPSGGSKRWGPWTAWSSCSKTCGQGIVYRKRLCHSIDRPPSNSSHTSCHGPDKQYKICKHNCTSRHKDYRTLQCEKHNGRFYGGKRYYWEAFINPYNRCELACKAKGAVRYYARFQETVEDGTPCKLDKDAICMKGRCLDVGCDGIAGSGSVVDQCGLCGGDGKSCRIISGIFTRRQLDTYGYNLITKIPSGACSINITELGKSRNYLALKVGGENGLYFLNGRHRLSPSGTVHGAGTDFLYGRSRNRQCPGECIYSDGPTKQDIEVQLLYYHHNPGITYQFTIPKHKVGAMINHSDGDTSRHRHRNRHRHHNSHKHHHGSQSTRRTTSPPTESPRTVKQEQSDMQILQRRRNGRRRIIPRRHDAPRTNVIHHSRSPHYIPSNDRNQQIRLSSTRRIIPRRYNSDTARHAAQGGYADRYPDGRYGTVLNSNRLPNKERQSHINRPHSQIVTSASSSSQNHQDSRRNRQRTRTRGTRQRSRTQHSNTNRLAGQTRPSSSSGNSGYNNVRQIPDDGEVYVWKISGFSECSRTCGGGFQETEIVCVKGSSGFVVTEENCDPQRLPHRQRVSCNNVPCPPGWESEEWSACSTTCGKGIQSRTVACKRRISPTLTISVTASLCLSIPRPAVSRMCELKPCAAWKISKWEKCSTECGHGERRRSVKCMSIEDKEVHDYQCGTNKPSETEICDMGSCAKGWYHTKWSAQCTTECGRGHYIRKIFCSADDGSYLPEAKCSSGKKPRTRKSCKSNPPCGGKWFAGPWSKCNSTCGFAVRKRDVVCMKKLGSKLHTIVSEVNCLAENQPIAQEACKDLSPCQPDWYMTPWGQCSASCGTGVKTREIKCLDSDLQPSMECKKSIRPNERQACNKHTCRSLKPQAITAADTQIQKDAGGDSDCKDLDSVRCLYVKQSRLCRYEFYKQMCCKSCREYILDKHHYFQVVCKTNDKFQDIIREKFKTKWTSPWCYLTSHCNSTCGFAVRKRDVVCMKKLGSKLHTIVSEVNCLAENQPIAQEACKDLSPCQPDWYMTPWGQCSASCGTGVKTREIKCLDSDLQPSMECKKSIRPNERQACNKHTCRSLKPQAITAADTQIQKDAGGDSDCKDLDSVRCLYVKQSRLCRYEFYKQMCCKSCREYILDKHH